MENDYQSALNDLREYVVQNERERRVWAGEKWGHREGRLYKLFRVLCPVLSAVSIISAIFYNMIRYFQMDLAAGNGLSYDVDESVSYMYIVTAFCLLTVAANILSFTRFHKLGIAMNGGVNLLMAIYLFTQINIKMPNNNYKTLIAFVCGVQLLIFVICAVMLIINFKDKKDMDTAYENILRKITAEKNGLTEESEYAKLIEDFLEKQSGKTPEQVQKKFRKNSD